MPDAAPLATHCTQRPSFFLLLALFPFCTPVSVSMRGNAPAIESVSLAFGKNAVGKSNTLDDLEKMNLQELQDVVEANVPRTYMSADGEGSTMYRGTAMNTSFDEGYNRDEHTPVYVESDMPESGYGGDLKGWRLIQGAEGRDTTVTLKLEAERSGGEDSLVVIKHFHAEPNASNAGFYNVVKKSGLVAEGLVSNSIKTRPSMGGKMVGVLERDDCGVLGRHLRNSAISGALPLHSSLSSLPRCSTTFPSFLTKPRFLVPFFHLVLSSFFPSYITTPGPEREILASGLRNAVHAWETEFGEAGKKWALSRDLINWLHLDESDSARSRGIWFRGEGGTERQFFFLMPYHNVAVLLGNCVVEWDGRLIHHASFATVKVAGGASMYSLFNADGQGAEQVRVCSPHCTPARPSDYCTSLHLTTVISHPPLFCVCVCAFATNTPLPAAPLCCIFRVYADCGTRCLECLPSRHSSRLS